MALFFRDTTIDAVQSDCCRLLSTTTTQRLEKRIEIRLEQTSQLRLRPLRHVHSLHKRDSGRIHMKTWVKITTRTTLTAQP